MKKRRYSESQIISILKGGDSGVPVTDICRKYEIVQSTYYKWKSKFGGMNTHQLKQLKQLEEENRRLKAMYAKVSLEKEVLQEALEGKF